MGFGVVFWGVIVVLGWDLGILISRAIVATTAQHRRQAATVVKYQQLSDCHDLDVQVFDAT